MKILQDPQIGEVMFRKSARSRNISIRVHPVKGVTVTGSLTPFSKTKQFYLLIDFLLKVFFLSNLIRIFVALYGTIAL